LETHVAHRDVATHSVHRENTRFIRKQSDATTPSRERADTHAYANCDICKKDKSYKSSLTNLKKHLSSCHMIFLKQEQSINKVSKLQINITLKQLSF